MILDLPTYNDLMGQCCPCGLPECAENSIKCQTLSATADARDTDYTDAYHAWLIANNLRQIWEDCQEDTPGECGEEPPDPGDEPAAPDGYDDPNTAHGAYAPFIQPDGEVTDDLPVIYRNRKYLSLAEPVTGESGVLLVESNDFGGQDAIWQKKNGVHGSATYSYKTLGWYTDEEDVDQCEVGSEVSEGPFYDHFFDDDWVWDNTVTPLNCTATVRQYETVESTSVSGTAQDAPACPGPWSPDGQTKWWDLTKKTGSQYTYSDGTTKSELIARAIDNIADTWPDEDDSFTTGGGCAAAMDVSWPKIGDLQTGADPDADPPVPAAWPACDASLALLETAGAAEVVKARYKVGVPAHYMDTPTLNYYALQWDVVFFPKEWDAWLELKVAFDEATAAHEAWEACEDDTPGECGEEPVIPAEPGEQPENRPAFVAEDLFWEFTGEETEGAQFSSWYEIPVPTAAGQTRIVNRQAKCWRSTRLGVPPTFFGETYNPDDYEE